MSESPRSAEEIQLLYQRLIDAITGTEFCLAAAYEVVLLFPEPIRTELFHLITALHSAINTTREKIQTMKQGGTP